MSATVPAARPGPDVHGRRVRVRGGVEALPGVLGPDAAADDVPEAADLELDAERLWLLPGVVDCHTHLAWHDFEDPTPDAAQAASALAATLRTGVTLARDAGGLDAALLATLPDGPRPALRLAGPMIGAADAGRGAGHLSRVVADAVAAGSTWIKVMATGGLGADPERVLDPVLTGAELLELGAAARAAGARVMAHAWGGPSLPWLVEAGVASIEHGIHLTAADARLLAANDVALVPTVAVYRWTADSHGLPAVIRDRAARAADAHPAAVAAARDAGVRIALGTDAGTPRQHGANLAEIAALVDAGLTAREALHAATVAGRELLGSASTDLVVLDVDPHRVDELSADRVVAVVVDGRLAHARPDAAIQAAPHDHSNPPRTAPGGTR